MGEELTTYWPCFWTNGRGVDDLLASVLDQWEKRRKRGKEGGKRGKRMENERELGQKRNGCES